VCDHTYRKIDSKTPSPGYLSKNSTKTLLSDLLFFKVNTGPILYAIAYINARKVFCVEFSLREFVSLITILVITKQPAAELLINR
jgi:hypothetical protein